MIVNVGNYRFLNLFAQGKGGEHLSAAAEELSLIPYAVA
jgi:hypothetical protein